MSDVVISPVPPPIDPLERYRLWAYAVAAVVAASLLSALVQRWVGVRVEIPPPPVIVVGPAGHAEPTVTVVQPKARP